MKILVDANIALDVLLQRHPFYISGTQVLGLSKGGVEVFISASTVTDIFYIIQKEHKNKSTALSLLKYLLSIVDIAAVSRDEIYRAIDLNWGDFEDAVQYAVGESILVDYIVTRNITDFSSATLPVISPDELLHNITRKIYT